MLLLHKGASLTATAVLDIAAGRRRACCLPSPEAASLSGQLVGLNLRQTHWARYAQTPPLEACLLLQSVTA